MAAVADLLTGERVGGFVLFVDWDGLRQGCPLRRRDGAVRRDSGGGETIMQLVGGRSVIIRRSVAEVLDWFR